MIAIVRRPPGGGGAVGEPGSAATQSRSESRWRRRPASAGVARDALVEAGEDGARELLLAGAEDGGEQLVPGARAEPGGSSATSARTARLRLLRRLRRAPSAPTPPARARRRSPAGRPRSSACASARKPRSYATIAGDDGAGLARRRARAQARGHRARLARAGRPPAARGRGRRAAAARPAARPARHRAAAQPPRDAPARPHVSPHDAQLRAVLEREAVVRREVLVDGAPAARPLVVVVEHDPPAGHQPRRDPLRHVIVDSYQSPSRWANATGPSSTIVSSNRPLTSSTLRSPTGTPSRANDAVDLAVEVVAVAVVGLAADAARVAGGDRLVALVDVLAVLLARRGDHPEDVVDLHRPLGRLRRGHDDRGAAERRPRLDHEPLQPGALDVQHVGGERAQVGAA